MSSNSPKYIEAQLFLNPGSAINKKMLKFIRVNLNTILTNKLKIHISYTDPAKRAEYNKMGLDKFPALSLNGKPFIGYVSITDGIIQYVQRRQQAFISGDNELYDAILYDDLIDGKTDKTMYKRDEHVNGADEDDDFPTDEEMGRRSDSYNRRITDGIKFRQEKYKGFNTSNDTDIPPTTEKRKTNNGKQMNVGKSNGGGPNIGRMNIPGQLAQSTPDVNMARQGDVSSNMNDRDDELLMAMLDI